MQIDDDGRKEVLDAFKSHYSIKSDAKVLVSGSNDNLKGLAEKLKVEPKVLKKAYSLWESTIKNPALVEQADSIVTLIN